MDPSLASSHYAQQTNHVSTQTRRKGLRSVTVQILPSSRPRTHGTKQLPRRISVPSPIQEEPIPQDHAPDPPNPTVPSGFPAATALKDLVFGIVRDRLPLIGGVLAGQSEQVAPADATQENPSQAPTQPPNGSNGAPPCGTQQDWYQRWLETMGLVADQMRERELRWTRRAIFTASFFSLLSLVMMISCPPVIIYKLMMMRSELAPRVHECIVHSVLFHHHLHHHEYDADDYKKRKTLRKTAERMVDSSRARRGALIDVDDLISHLKAGSLGGGRQIRLDSLQQPPEQPFTVLNQGLPYSIGVMNSGYELDGSNAYAYSGQQQGEFQPDYGSPQPPVASTPVAELCCSYTTGPPGAAGQPGQPGQPGTSFPLPPPRPTFFRPTTVVCPPCKFLTGPPGPPGPKGAPGYVNYVAVKGLPGPPGGYGPCGPNGPPGPPGPADPGRVIEIEVTGAEGPPGPPGSPGLPGKQGRPGRRGKNGHKGPEGVCGRHGTPGNPGRTGAPGPIGKAGRNGVCACKTQSIKQISTESYGETQQGYDSYRSFKDTVTNNKRLTVTKRPTVSKFPVLRDSPQPIAFDLPDNTSGL